MEAVARNKHLSTFGLWSEDTTDYALEQVGKMLESNDVVESLSIDNADLVTGKGVESIGNGLMKNRNVKTITLRVGKTSDESMLPLFRTLSKPDSPVRMLTFTTKSEEESERFGDRAAIALSQHLEKNKELLVLNLQHTNIGDIGATAIFQALANHTELNHLALRNCSKITDAGGVIIGQYIESDPGLTELMLDHSSIGDQGARYIGKALSKNSHLDTLSLVNTPISDTGALAIVSGMNDNMILTDVVLRRTGRNVREMWREALLPKIEKDTEKMLADILKRNKEWKPLVHRLAELEGKTAAAAAAAARGEQDDDSSQTTTAGERHSEL
jgi:Ran GTPase-activating protein (RanGAP) involved in mRNA processing and transport